MVNNTMGLSIYINSSKVRVNSLTERLGLCTESTWRWRLSLHNAILRSLLKVHHLFVDEFCRGAKVQIGTFINKTVENVYKQYKGCSNIQNCGVKVGDRHTVYICLTSFLSNFVSVRTESLILLNCTVSPILQPFCFNSVMGHTYE